MVAISHMHPSISITPTPNSYFPHLVDTETHLPPISSPSPCFGSQLSPFGAAFYDADLYGWLHLMQVVGSGEGHAMSWIWNFTLPVPASDFSSTASFMMFPEPSWVGLLG